MSDISLAQQSGWASGLLGALGDTVTSTSSVVLWLQSNLGLLNARLTTNFAVIESGYISPEFNSIQSGIYNEMYICSWLRKKAVNLMGGMEFDWIEMKGEDQGSIKRVSNLQKSASYQTMSKDCDALIKDLIKTYRGGDFARPRQITFNNRHSTPANISCDCYNWSELNPINDCC